MIRLHSFWASLRENISTPKHLGPEPISSRYGPIFFIQGRRANDDVSQEKQDKAIQVSRSYNDAVKHRGIRFIFLPLPNKENILNEYLETKKPIFLEQWTSGLKRHGIETIDTQKPFEEVFEENKVLLYHTDDTHWNANGVELKVELISI